jgi:hypothetical protein
MVLKPIKPKPVNPRAKTNPKPVSIKPVKPKGRTGKWTGYSTAYQTSSNTRRGSRP